MKSPIDKKIILASNSPRRRELLRYIIPDFEIAPSRDIDEDYPENLPVEEVAPYISREKAEAYRDLLTNDNVIVTADTVVCIDNHILGKPHDKDDALRMLKTLSGRQHKVITGVTVMSLNRIETFSCATDVFFDNLSDEELEEYIEEFRPFDKAGAYGVQEWIGSRGIRRIEGCFYNVMGLPLNRLYTVLKCFNG